MKNKLKIAINIALSSILITTLSGCKKEETKKAEVLRPVRYITAKPMTTNNHKVFAGVVQSDKKSALSFKVSGNIQKIYVENGDKINKDQLLARLDKEPYEIRLQEAEARFLQAKANARNAITNYDRLKNLYIEGVISDSQLDNARAAAESTANLLKSAGKGLDYAKLQMQYTSLYAPMSGYIASLNKEDGENVSSGKKVLEIISNSKQEVLVNIPESKIDLIQKDTDVKIKISPLGEELFEGVIKEIAVDSANNSTTYPVTVTIKNSNSKIKTGMSADVYFDIYKNKENAFFVPISAVANDTEGKYIYVVELTGKGIGTTHKKPVKIGEITSKGIEIKEGLNAKEKVVIAGVSRIVEGQSVKLGE